MISEYLFTSQRLGFREWKPSDIPLMAAINADSRVMEFFPSVQSAQQTSAFVLRNQQLFAESGYCYFAVDLLDTNEFIGFIGLSRVTFEADFTPCIDIGWRLAFKFWNQGYATEGAMRCLDYAISDLKISSLFAISPAINEKSINIMKKLGMNECKDFIHPLLLDFDNLKLCKLFSYSR